MYLTDLQTTCVARSPRPIPKHLLRTPPTTRSIASRAIWRGCFARGEYRVAGCCRVSNKDISRQPGDRSLGCRCFRHCPGLNPMIWWCCNVSSAGTVLPVASRAGGKTFWGSCWGATCCATPTAGVVGSQATHSFCSFLAEGGNLDVDQETGSSCGLQACLQRCEVSRCMIATS